MSAKTYDRQSGKLVARIAENLPEMSGDVMQGWIDNPVALQKVLCGALCPPLLQFVQIADVSTISEFAAKDHLRAANIGWTGKNFKKFFLNEVEKDMLAGEIVISKLQRASLDAPILEELGDQAEIRLAQFFDLIKKQARGQSGVLLVNGFANIAYVRSKKDNNLWAVDVRWGEFCRYWNVEADSVEILNRWRAGDQVLFRK